MPRAKDPSKPRRTPRQSRARVLVDALTEAGERLLSARGYDRLSTTKIAELAGVSIGSLYQYFPRKEALIASLIDRRLEDDVKAVRALVEETRDQPFETLVVRAMDEMIPETPAKQAFLKEVVGALERTSRLEAVQRVFDTLAQEMAEAIRARRDEFRADLDPDFAAHSLTWAARAIILARLRVEPKFDAPRLRRELLAMAKGYLGGSFADRCSSERFSPDS